MTTIEIERSRDRMAINGKPATEREITVVANQIYGQPARFFCLERDDRGGRWVYADLGGAVQEIES